MPLPLPRWLLIAMPAWFACPHCELPIDTELLARSLQDNSTAEE